MDGTHRIRRQVITGMGQCHRLQLPEGATVNDIVHEGDSVWIHADSPVPRGPMVERNVRVIPATARVQPHERHVCTARGHTLVTVR